MTHLPNDRPMLGQRRTRWPTYVQHWVAVSCLLGNKWVPRVRFYIKKYADTLGPIVNDIS